MINVKFTFHSADKFATPVILMSENSTAIHCFWLQIASAVVMNNNLYKQPIKLPNETHYVCFFQFKGEELLYDTLIITAF